MGKLTKREKIKARVLQIIWALSLIFTKRKQGNTYLRQGDRFCCLGQQCEFFGIPAKADEAGDFPVYRYDGERSGLPEKQARKLNMCQGGTLKKHVADQGSLIGLNDSANFTFRQIGWQVLKGNLVEWEG